MRSFLIYSFLIFFISVSQTFGQSKDTLSVYYYNKGLSAVSINDLETAKDLFKQSVREEANAPAEYELAKIYMADTSHSMWNISREHIKNAVKLDPKNITYRLFYASLSKALSKKYSNELVSEGDVKIQYEKILEIDSTNILALEGLGEIKANEFLEFHNSKKQYENADHDSTTILLKKFQSRGFRRLGRTASQQLSEAISYFDTDVDGFAQKDFKDAIGLLNKAIKYDSLNPNPYLTLSSVFEDNGIPEEGIPYLQRLEKIYPNSKDVHLNLGLLYYRTNKVDSSYIEYQEAIDLMNESEKLDFTYNSVIILLDPYLKDNIDNLSKDQLKNVINSYWKSRDPLNITKYNERLLEHYTRVAYANLRFSLPKSGLTGWETDRGITVIKYGIPPKRIRYRPYVIIGERLTEIYKTDVWKYKNKTFGFVDEFKNGNFQFSRPDRTVGRGGGESQFWDDSKEYIDNLEATHPDDYVPVFNGPVFDVPYKAVQFKDGTKNNLTDVYVSYGIKTEKYPAEESNYNYEHKTGIYFFDKYFNRVADNVKNIEILNIQNKIFIPDSGNFIVNSIEMETLPDSGNFSFEILRTADKGVAAYHGRYVVKSFDNRSLALSDILLASNINRNSGEDGTIKRKNIAILPNPTGIFSKAQDLYIYYEVYNLDKNSNGLTDFKQNIILQKKDEDGTLGKIFSPLLKLVGINKEEKKVELTSNYQTKDKDSQIYLQLDMNNYEPGDYVLTIKIKDNITGKETEQKTELTYK